MGNVMLLSAFPIISSICSVFINYCGISNVVAKRGQDVFFRITVSGIEKFSMLCSILKFTF